MPSSAAEGSGTATGPVIPVQPDTSPLDMHGLACCGSAVVPTAGLRVSHGDFARTGTRNRRGGDGPTVGESVGAVDDRLEHAEVMAEVTAACRRLPARDRRILYLRFYEERTQQEIASELGVTQMQVSRLLTRILSWLREELSPAEGVEVVA